MKLTGTYHVSWKCLKSVTDAKSIFFQANSKGKIPYEDKDNRHWKATPVKREREREKYLVCEPMQS